MLGTDSGVKLFEAMVKVEGTTCLNLSNQVVEEIKLEKVYQDMGLSDQEYEKVCDILGRQPNFTETGTFLLGGVNIALINILNRFKAISHVR